MHKKNKNFFLVKLFLLFLMIYCSLGAFNFVKAAEDKTNTLIIHYFRYNQDYDDGWDFWIWQKAPSDKAGAAYKFDIENKAIKLDNYGAVATINLSDEVLQGSTKIGIIIKKGDWSMKDISIDRFIDIPDKSEDGTIHRYFVEDDERIGTSLDDPNGPDRTDKIRYAYFANETTINFALTAKLEASKIVLNVDNVDTNAVVTMNGTSGTIKLTDKLDFNHTYSLKATFSSGLKTYSITYDGIYDSKVFEESFTYEGNDLGVSINNNKTSFKIWAPISLKVVLNIYTTGTPSSYGGNDKIEQSIELQKGEKGVWSTTVNENLHGKYYTYSVTNGTTTYEVIDPYAKSAGINGIRGMIVDFSIINPKDFNYNSRANNITNPTDAIIYELHVRDLTAHSSWNGPNEYRGKFLGLTVTGTKYQNVTTGLDHIKELGVTHVQLLPFFDYGVIDESTKKNTFNWGYMPLNFNVPEGYYSTNPYDGLSRVTELKQMTTALTNNNIGVVMDVVYNHTGQTADSNFNLIVPGYYHRLNSDGSFSNGSGCGNETASNRSMMRKFIVDSVKFWATEYNLSGFRFDLMALHDTETMNEVYNELHKIDDKILVYGEPWNGGTTPLSDSEAAGKGNISKMDGVAAFNDEIRDGIKGSVFDAAGQGYIQGVVKADTINKVKYGIVGGVNHPDVTTNGLSNNTFWHSSPTRTINYVSAHDNNTLYDKIALSTSSKQRDLRIEMQKQANAIVLTSQGIPFIHAGAEFMRSKPAVSGGYDSNSYESPDSTNQLRWDLKAQADNLKCFEYYKGLINLRKNHPAFRMTKPEDVVKNLDFVYTDKTGIIAYTISNYANNDTWGTILVINNNSLTQLQSLVLPSGTWNLVANSTKVTLESFKTYEGGNTINVFANETLILYSGEKELPKDVKTGCSCQGTEAIISSSFLLCLYLFRKKKYLFMD